MFKNFYANAYFNNITDVSPAYLKERGIQGIILDIGNDFLNVAPKAQKSKYTKMYKWTISKCFCTAKKTIIMKRQLVFGKIFANIDLISN